MEARARCDVDLHDRLLRAEGGIEKRLPVGPPPCMPAGTRGKEPRGADTPVRATLALRFVNQQPVRLIGDD